MKQKTTIKYLKNLYGNDAIHLGYCEAQCLFPERDANYYTCGVYGWNFDGFCVNGAIVTTGYRGMFGVMPDSELVKEYEQKASEYYFLTDYNELKSKLYELQKEFVNKVLKK